MRFPDSQNLRRFSDSQNLGSQILRISDTQILRIRISDSRVLRISDCQNLWFSDCQNLRFSTSQNLRFSDSQNLKISDSQNLRIQLAYMFQNQCPGSWTGSPWLPTGSYSVRTKPRPPGSFLNTSRALSRLTKRSALRLRLTITIAIAFLRLTARATHDTINDNDLPRALINYPDNGTDTDLQLTCVNV